MSSQVGSYGWKCATCGMSVSSSENLTVVGPVTCWRIDCPGKQPKKPKLALVK